MFETWLACDLSEGVLITPLTGNVFSQDKMANKIGVIVTKDGAPVTLSGTVQGLVIRADESTVVVTGELEQNKAWIILPQSAYSVVGAIQITIRIIGETSSVTIGACSGYVHRSMTNAIIDDETLYDFAVIPTTPIANGTYILKLTITNGVETYAWEAVT